ncbi:enoyl-acyl carrier-protein reductase NADH [Gracilaria domingensis]|nr:enoyl-acyl carrier-protein reductase NADH [Gracilaria domingensis]
MTAAQTAPATSSPLIDLQGKKALVTGIANNRSIAWGIAQQLHAAGAEIGIAFLPINERAEGKVQKLTQPLEPTLFEPCDVSDPDQIASLAAAIADKWGGVDIFVHCLAFADRADLEGSFCATKKTGFDTALRISAYSLIEMVGALRPHFNPNASIVTLTYIGSEKVVPNYNIMGVAKAALESSVRYIASELGPEGIRCNAVSAGPIRTLASSAIGGITRMIKHVEQTAPLRRTVTPTEVGNAAAFLLSPASSGITGQVIYVDAGYESVGAPNL